MTTHVANFAARGQRWLAPLLGLMLFAVTLGVVHRELEHCQLRDVLTQLRGLPHHQLLAALVCTGLSYLLLSGFDHAGLRYVRKSLPVARVMLSSFVAYAVSNSLGASWITGGALRYRLYAPQLAGAEVATLQGFCSITSLLGIAVLIGVSLLVAPEQAAHAPRLPQPWPGMLAVMLLATVSGYIAWGCRGRRAVELRGWTLRPPGALLTAWQVALGTLELCVAGAVLWWLLPVHASVGFVSFIGIYALAVAAGIVSHVPGGLGVFESMLLLALPRLPADALMSALLAYRVLYYLLPLLGAGLVYAVREIYASRPQLARVETVLAAYIAPVAPQLVGTSVLLAGVVLLISGATPGVHVRLHALRELIPLPVLETSQLLGSMSGVGLMVLSRALFRRVHEGWRLAMLLLGAGVVASILKGLDIEEAGVLALVGSVLWLGRRAFHRRASIIEERFTPLWIVGIVGVLVAVTWIGFFSHRHVEYSNSLWWTFAFEADAPRMLRASLIAALLTAAFLAMNLLRPARPQPELPQARDLDLARNIIAGATVALPNAVLAADKRVLFAPRSDAFIMYQVANRSWVALGDPVGERAAHAELVWQFRELVDQHGGWTVFHQVSAEYLPLYLDIGLAPIKVGEEARVPLTQFDLQGSARATLRQSHRRAQRDGASFEVVAAGEVEPLLPALRAISDAWLEEKATAEKGFSIGAFSEHYVRNFPVAVVRRDGVPVAFASLWDTATRAELSVDLMRFGAQAPSCAMDYLFTELMLWGRAQGYGWFNLGMAPLAGLEQHPLAPSWHRIGNFVFRHGEHFYNFAGLRHYKSKFAPTWEPKYLAAPPGLLVLPRVLLDVSLLVAGGVRELLSK